MSVYQSSLKNSGHETVVIAHGAFYSYEEMFHSQTYTDRQLQIFYLILQFFSTVCGVVSLLGFPQVF